MRNRDYVMPGLVTALIVMVSVHLWTYQPDPAKWPQYDYFRCRECGGPAGINPEKLKQWGCRRCGYCTKRVAEKFRTPHQGELTVGELGNAMTQAGVVVPHDSHETPLVYWKSQQK